MSSLNSWACDASHMSRFRYQKNGTKLGVIRKKMKDESFMNKATCVLDCEV